MYKDCLKNYKRIFIFKIQKNIKNDRYVNAVVRPKKKESVSSLRASHNRLRNEQKIWKLKKNYQRTTYIESNQLVFEY